jgi:dephospho-CoA kinase
MSIVVLCGKKGVGKNQAASFICKKYGYAEVAFADILKLMTIDLIDVFYDVKLDKDVFFTNKKDMAIKELKDKTPRYFLQKIGMIFRKYNSDIWCMFVTNKLRGKVVITDCRFENELKFVKGVHKDTISIMVHRKTNTKDEHISENVAFETDHIIDNNGTIDELNNKLINILGDIH